MKHELIEHMHVGRRPHLGQQGLSLEAGVEMVLSAAMLSLKPLPSLAQAELATILQLLCMAPLVQAASLFCIALLHLHRNVACPGLHQPVAPWAKSGHASKSEPGIR